jgi:hypothetical protein
MTRILALDTGGKCGWVVGTTEPEAFGTASFDATDRAARWWAFHAWLADMVDTHEPELIAYEAPIHRGAGSLTLAGFVVVAELVAYLHELGIVPVNNATLKKHAGVRHGKLVEVALARGWAVEDDHQADAAWLLDYVASGLDVAA